MSAADLIGPELDAAVANALGLPTVMRDGITLLFTWDDRHLAIPDRYSTDWSQGGPIIERQQIALLAPIAQTSDDLWQAYAGKGSARGPTPLIAAMRAYVASRGPK